MFAMHEQLYFPFFLLRLISFCYISHFINFQKQLPDLLVKIKHKYNFASSRTIQSKSEVFLTCQVSETLLKNYQTFTQTQRLHCNVIVQCDVSLRELCIHLCKIVKTKMTDDKRKETEYETISFRDHVGIWRLGFTRGTLSYPVVFQIE